MTLNFAGKFDFSQDGLSALASAPVAVTAPAQSGGDIGATIVPDARLLFSGDYARSGLDLVLSKDGHSHVVADYFKGASRATLASPDGARLSGDLVHALVGEVQLAQLGGGNAAAQVIGTVTKLTGSATAIRNGVSILLNVGDTVQKGDVVQAGSASSLGLTFIDGTVFGLSANARMVLNEMVYDPNGSSNSSLLSLVQGTITFVAGETAKHGDMRVDTPVATMGIRGTAVLVEIGFEVPGQGGAPPVKFQVLVEPGGVTGSYVLYSKTTGQIIGTVNQAGQVTSVSGLGDTLTAPADPLSPIAQGIIQQTLQQYFPNYVPNANPRSNGSGSGSTPSDPNSGTSPDPLKFVPSPDPFPGQPFTVPINLPGDTPGTPPINVTITRFNTAPTVFVAPVAVTLPVDRTSFEIRDQVTITDPDATDVAIPYVPGTARILSVTGPSNAPPALDLKTLVTIDPQTGHVSYNPAAFKFLADGQKAVYTIGFDSQSGPDTIRETLTFTVDGSNDTPVVAAPLVVAVTQDSAPQTVNLLDGATDPDSGDTASLSVSHVKYALGNAPASVNPPTGISLVGTTLHVDPAAFAYLGAGQTAKIVVTYDVTDTHGATVAQTETITVTGTNDAPVIVSGDTTASQSIVVMGTTTTVRTTGKITFADPDVGDSHSIMSVTYTGAATALGALAFTLVDTTSINPDGQFTWTYTATDAAAVQAALLDSDNGTKVETFKVTISDGHGGSVVQTVSVTLSEANAAVWVGGTSGNWNAAANWSPAGVPTTSTIAYFNTAATVNLTSSVTIAGLHVAQSDLIHFTTTGGGHLLDVTGALINHGILQLGSGVTLELSGVVQNSGDIIVDVESYQPAGATLLIDGHVSLEGHGHVTLDGISDAITGHFSFLHPAILENVDNTINGYGQLGDGYLNLINDLFGKIIASNAFHGIDIDTGFGFFVNHGLVASYAAGGLKIEGRFYNDGTLEAKAGLLEICGKVTGHGHAIIDGGAMEFGNDSDVSVVFASGTTGTLVLDDPDDFTGTISGYSNGDSIQTGYGAAKTVRSAGDDFSKVFHYAHGPDLIIANSNDTSFTHILTGNSNDDIFIGSSAADNFVFAAHLGNDTITNYQRGVDHIDLSAVVTTNHLTDWIHQHVSQSRFDPSDTLIIIDAHDTITLHNVLASSLTVSDFIVHSGGSPHFA
ncbi:VCBS domain-containing protein [Tardiphaga sp.]|uniref:VCBS domain-containing protein n=1 Tax=Tardiphaga sp. TaxID=1926292 RepID=UPI0025E6CDB6|nr:VCBS domain-containing protein [Tardiphaga sp.]